MRPVHVHMRLIGRRCTLRGARLALVFVTVAHLFVISRVQVMFVLVVAELLFRGRVVRFVLGFGVGRSRDAVFDGRLGVRGAAVVQFQRVVTGFSRPLFQVARPVGGFARRDLLRIGLLWFFAPGDGRRLHDAVIG